MIVYADTVIFINFLADYILLYLTATFLHLKINFSRLVIASILGSVFALFCMCFMFDCSIPRLVLGVLILALLCRIAYGKLKNILLIKCIIAMLVFSIVLGGTVSFIYSQNGNFYEFGVLVLPICCYLLLLLYKILTVIFSVEVKSKRISVVIEMFDKEYSVELLCDSGNLLIDPYSRLPVVVLKKAFESGCEDLETRLVPVNTACGEMLMKVITPQKIYAIKNGNQIPLNAAIGFSCSDASFNGCDGIIPLTLVNTV